MSRMGDTVLTTHRLRRDAMCTVKYGLSARAGFTGSGAYVVAA